MYGVMFFFNISFYFIYTFVSIQMIYKKSLPFYYPITPGQD